MNSFYNVVSKRCDMENLTESEGVENLTINVDIENEDIRTSNVKIKSDSESEKIEKLIKQKCCDLELVSRKVEDRSKKIISFNDNGEPQIVDELQVILKESKKDGYDYKIFDCKNLIKDKGVYCFYSKEDFDISFEDLFLPFVQIGKEGENLKAYLVCVPKINLTVKEKQNMNKNYKAHILKGELLYVGEAENIESRYKSHINDKINKTSSLKLGLRKSLSNKTGYFYISVPSKESKTRLEKAIRQNFHPRFGE